jgi:hypothetical protein
MRSYNANDQTNEHNIVKPIDEDRSFTGNVQTRGVTGWSGRYTERPDRTSMTLSIEGSVSTECLSRRSHGRCSAESSLQRKSIPLGKYRGEPRGCYSFRVTKTSLLTEKSNRSREMWRYGNLTMRSSRDYLKRKKRKKRKKEKREKKKRMC